MSSFPEFRFAEFWLTIGGVSRLVSYMANSTVAVSRNVQGFKDLSNVRAVNTRWSFFKSPGCQILLNLGLFPRVGSGSRDGEQPNLWWSGYRFAKL